PDACEEQPRQDALLCCEDHVSKLLNKTTMAAAAGHSEYSGARAACGAESFLRRQVRYEPAVRGTIGRAKMLRLPRVNIVGAQGRTAAPRRCRRAVRSLLDAAVGYFSAGR